MTEVWGTLHSMNVVEATQSLEPLDAVSILHAGMLSMTWV